MESRPSDQEILDRFIVQPLLPPQHGEPPPAAPNIRWHRSQVFRPPARSCAKPAE
jgi:hypothetical protein